MKITNHTELLNALIEKYGLKSYLEIGVQNPANNFDNIKCEYKTGVDPELKSYSAQPCTGKYNIIGQTSDDAFKILIADTSSKCGPDKPFVTNFDLIFIDGLHHADQVKRDFENSIRCLSDKGFIVIHDVLPENEEGTIVPRQTKVWWGDVYKTAMHMHSCPGVDFKTFDIDNGCMLIWKDETKNPFARIPKFCYYDTWESYQLHGRTLMNVTDEVDQLTI